MSKSTSISDLPINNSNDGDNSEEAMMVNSILQEIEQEEESLNDENLDSLNYVMDTSQVPPKINNEIPTPEIIKSVTQEIFEQPQVMPPIETMEEPPKEEKEEIRKVLENKPSKETKTGKLAILKDVDGLVNVVKKKVVGPVLVLVLFMILAHPKINKILLKMLPKLGNFKGEMNNLGNLLKGLIISVILFIVSFFV